MAAVNAPVRRFGVADTIEIKCVSRTERMSPHERITHVGGYENSQ
jgi:hypothetical protein